MKQLALGQIAFNYCSVGRRSDSRSPDARRNSICLDWAAAQVASQVLRGYFACSSVLL